MSLEDEIEFRKRMGMRMDSSLWGRIELPAAIRESLSPPETPFEFPSLDNPETAGLDIIGNMSRAALIQELLHHQLVLLNDMSDFDLKRHIIHMRMGSYQKRLVDEAKLDEDQPPPMGILQFIRRDDD